MRERKGGRSTQHIYNTNNFTLKYFKYVNVHVCVFTSKAFLNCRDDISNSERILIASSSK